MPGSVGRYTERPKHYLEGIDHWRQTLKISEKANIDAYLSACVAIGVPSQDMFTQLDLSETRKDMNQVVNNLYALARQAQAIGYQGPSLGRHTEESLYWMYQESLTTSREKSK